MSTNIEFKLDNNATLEDIYIMVEDGGFEIKEDLSNELRIIIPTESKYLVSKTIPMFNPLKI